MIDSLLEFGLIYLATPYSKYEKGITYAFADAACLTGQLLKRGVKVYSPIAHTHPIAIYANINPLDHAIWLPFDQAIMTKADALLVAKMDGWNVSYGIGEEIKFFKQAEKPIFYLNPNTFEVDTTA